VPIVLNVSPLRNAKEDCRCIGDSARHLGPEAVGGSDPPERETGHGRTLAASVGA